MISRNDGGDDGDGNDSSGDEDDDEDKRNKDPFTPYEDEGDAVPNRCDYCKEMVTRLFKREVPLRVLACNEEYVKDMQLAWDHTTIKIMWLCHECATGIEELKDQFKKAKEEYFEKVKTHHMIKEERA